MLTYTPCPGSGVLPLTAWTFRNPSGSPRWFSKIGQRQGTCTGCTRTLALTKRGMVPNHKPTERTAP